MIAPSRSYTRVFLSHRMGINRNSPPFRPIRQKMVGPPVLLGTGRWRMQVNAVDRSEPRRVRGAAALGCAYGPDWRTAGIWRQAAQLPGPHAQKPPQRLL